MIVDVIRLGHEFDAKQPYSNQELAELPPDSVVTRGNYCSKCKRYVPLFDAVPPDVAASIREINSRLIQIKRVVDLTGCPLGWAKLWAFHQNGESDHPLDYGPPCPHCDKNIRTDRAKQCLHCGADWH